jgi:hypothetical protein
MGLFSSNPKSDASVAKNAAREAASNYYAIHAELSKIAQELDTLEGLLTSKDSGHTMSSVKRMMKAHRHNSAKIAYSLGTVRKQLKQAAETLKARR